MKDNRGFSLLELIIVIAILAIIVGFGLAGLGYIFGTNARACANEIYSAIGKNRITTMGKDETSLRIYRDGAAGVYFKQEWVDGIAAEDPDQVGKSTVEIAYWIKGDTTEYILDGTTELIITFDRASGKESDLPVTVNGVSTQGVLCERIEVRGGGRVYPVRIEPATGKVTK